LKIKPNAEYVGARCLAVDKNVEIGEFATNWILKGNFFVLQDLGTDLGFMLVG